MAKNNVSLRRNKTMLFKSYIRRYTASEGIEYIECVAGGRGPIHVRSLKLGEHRAVIATISSLDDNNRSQNLTKFYYIKPLIIFLFLFSVFYFGFLGRFCVCGLCGVCQRTFLQSSKWATNHSRSYRTHAHQSRHKDHSIFESHACKYGHTGILLNGFIHFLT